MEMGSVSSVSGGRRAASREPRLKPIAADRVWTFFRRMSEHWRRRRRGGEAVAVAAAAAVTGTATLQAGRVGVGVCVIQTVVISM